MDGVHDVLAGHTPARSFDYIFFAHVFYDTIFPQFLRKIPKITCGISLDR